VYDLLLVVEHWRMTKSSPRDLAVAFRSLARRLHDAHNDETPADVSASATAEVHQAIARAAAVLGSPATAEGVADAIASRRNDQWTDADLTAIQEDADAAARAIRTVQNFSERS